MRRRIVAINAVALGTAHAAARQALAVELEAAALLAVAPFDALNNPAAAAGHGDGAAAIVTDAEERVGCAEAVM